MNTTDANTPQGDDQDQCAPQNISSTVRIKKARKLADHELTRSSTPRVRARVADAGDDAGTGGSSRHASSTILLGNAAFAIVRRGDQAVPGYYVHCPCHTFNDGTRRRACGKAISITQPDEETVILRLHDWILQGLKMNREDDETDESLRRRHVKYDSWQFGKLQINANANQLIMLNTQTYQNVLISRVWLRAMSWAGPWADGRVIKKIINKYK